jgi:phage portal protein BeeE
MTSFAYLEVLMSHLLLYGNCFSQIVRNGLHQVVGLYPLLPNKIEMNRDDNGELFYTYQLDYGEPSPNHDKQSQTVTLPKSEVLHIRGLSHDGLFGYSPVKLNRNAI